MQYRTKIAALSLGTLLLFATLPQARATLFTIDQTIDLSTVELNSGFQLHSPVIRFPAITLAVGDVINYDVTFTNGKIVGGTGPDDRYSLFAFLAEGVVAGTNRDAQCHEGTSSISVGTSAKEGPVSSCSGFFWVANFRGEIDGFSATFVIERISILDPDLTEPPFDGALFDLFPGNDATPLRIVLDTTASVPEPASAGLLAAGLVAAFMRKRRRGAPA